VPNAAVGASVPRVATDRASASSTDWRNRIVQGGARERADRYVSRKFFRRLEAPGLCVKRLTERKSRFLAVDLDARLQLLTLRTRLPFFVRVTPGF